MHHISFWSATGDVSVLDIPHSWKEDAKSSLSAQGQSLCELGTQMIPLAEDFMSCLVSSGL